MYLTYWEAAATLHLLKLLQCYFEDPNQIRAKHQRIYVVKFVLLTLS